MCFLRVNTINMLLICLVFTVPYNGTTEEEKRRVGMENQNSLVLNCSDYDGSIETVKQFAVSVRKSTDIKTSRVNTKNVGSDRRSYGSSHQDVQRAKRDLDIVAIRHPATTCVLG